MFRILASKISENVEQTDLTVMSLLKLIWKKSGGDRKQFKLGEDNKNLKHGQFSLSSNRIFSNVFKCFHPFFRGSRDLGKVIVNTDYCEL